METIGEFINFFKEKKQTKFNFGLSDPFSWRGSYDEVCFTIIPDITCSKKEIIDKLEKAKIGVFYGWKGGEYEYDDNTHVNFESREDLWSDDGYVFNMLFDLLCNK